ncbi:MAG: glycosyltransferase family 39 protein [Anaerolineae bacterium]|nr:glycosyltransferase family 39 protein [Anaerolineae bacterium]
MPEIKRLKLSSPFYVLLLLIVLVLAGWVRTYNLDWDKGQHLHPDERYLTMVAGDIRFPEELSGYWDTANSPLNPNNYPQYSGYVYGTMPLFSTRAAAMLVDQACGKSPTKLGTALRGILFNVDNPCPEGLYTGYNGVHLVGRILSTLADLCTLLGLALLARALYGNLTSLLAATLYAFCALPIQHAHFFVVDSFATVFVVWALYFAVLAVQARLRFWLVLAGLFTGMAVACKISVWPLAGMVALATFLVRDATEENPNHYHFAWSWSALVWGILSGLAAAFAFRVGQPYAFTGPGFFNVTFDPRWLTAMRDIRELVSGLRDVPYGHQWTNRIPILFPGYNMIFWGMGLPLGTLAWVGWGVLGWRIIRHRGWQHLIVWVWGTLFFLYQGTQWVKSMRYFLPVYPVFTLFAAWFAIRGMEWTLSSELDTLWKRILRPLLLATPVVVLVGAVAWAIAFLHIYAEPFTRIEASRWVYDNVPTAITVHTAEAVDINVPLTPDTMVSKSLGLPAARFVAPRDVTVTGVTFNKLNGVDRDGARELFIRIQPELALPDASIVITVTAELLAKGTKSVSVDMPPMKLAEGEAAYLAVDLLAGDMFKLQTSVIATEHWDDSVPVRLDNKDAFWNWYVGFQMTTYDNDTPEKRKQLFNWLDQADYISLSSNRLYASIPRLAMRYPFSTAYYEALFNGSLGFELAAEFVSYPTLGPCQFPDQEIPFALVAPKYTTAHPCSIPYPPAEEAYSVYDHPTVLIFRKTEAYTRAHAESILPESLLDNVQWMTPLEATRNKGKSGSLLLMDDRTQQVQADGGTWSELFNRDALQNRIQIVAVFLWWLMLAALGLIAFPWLYAAFPGFRYRGYGMTRIVGLLLWAYIAWLLSSLRIFPHTRLLLWGIFLLLGALSVYLIWRNRSEYWEFFRTRWKDLLRIETIFALLYLGWVWFRFLNPDLWHEVSGGEKPMDFAYLNAVIKSTWFPPYDPWFSGGTMNYYYFGFVMIGSLIKALGIIPSIAYNLAVPSLFAMTGVGAYTLAFNLSGQDDRRANRAGMLGLLMVVLLGNLGELRLIFKGFEAVGDVHFESLIPGYPTLVSVLAGIWKVVVEGRSLMFRPEWWYWNATRMIPDDVGSINEFPAFTFLYSDLHAHMIALPLTQVALAIGLQWGIGSGAKKRLPALSHWRRWGTGIVRSLPTFLLAALTAGALRATNTWDYPTYLGLMSFGILLSLFKAHPVTLSTEEEAAPSSKPHYILLIVPVLLLVTAEILFHLFTKNYAVAYAAFSQWMGQRTPLGIYLMMHGQFLFPLTLLAVWQAKSAFQRFYHTGSNQEMQVVTAVVFVGGVLLIGLRLMGVSVALAIVPLGILAALLVIAPRTTPRMASLWFWVGTALTLSLLVEIFVLKGDIGRMNTVFKFYLQMWMLLAVASAVAVEQLFDWALKSVPDDKFSFARDVVFSTLIIILFSTALYPVIAIPAKARDRWEPAAPHTLDGMAYIPYITRYEHGGTASLDVDYRVIRWLQDNVKGSPTIIETQAEREYLWGNRISIYTGLPSVAAWRWHQVQQRMVMPGYTVESRQDDIRDFYNTISPDHAMEILRRYGVEYVILTPYERVYMVPEGEVKFAQMVERGWLEVAYEEPDAKIYRVLLTHTPTP